MKAPESLLSFLSGGRSFVVSTHKSCDGDGLGAGIALCHILKKIKKKARFLTLEPPHPKYSFLNGGGLLGVCGGKSNFSAEDSALVIVDASDFRLAEPLYSQARKAGLPVCFIDHHPLLKKADGDLVFTDTGASSTAELVYAVLKGLGVSMDENIAPALFTSIVFDTTRFRDVKNSPAPFSIAAECVPYIKDVNFIYESLFKTMTAGGLRLMAKLRDIEYCSGGAVAFLYLAEKDLRESGADMTQAYDLMELARNVSSIDSTALVIEAGGGAFKLSLRSRKKDLLPLAKSFGGGGHRHSAGALVAGSSLKDIKERALAYLCESGRRGASGFAAQALRRKAGGGGPLKGRRRARASAGSRQGRRR